jgi:hypothetical protein
MQCISVFCRDWSNWFVSDLIHYITVCCKDWFKWFELCQALPICVQWSSCISVTGMQLVFFVFIFSVIFTRSYCWSLEDMEFYGLDSNVAAVESILCKRAIYSAFLGLHSGTEEFHVQGLWIIQDGSMFMQSRKVKFCCWHRSCLGAMQRHKARSGAEFKTHAVLNSVIGYIKNASSISHMFGFT